VSEFGPRVLLGDCRETLLTLPDESVHCVVTSPPYWGLRDYGCEGQIGLEATPEEHVAVLVEVFREVKRVLHRTGTLWVNYGDAYAGSWGAQGRTGQMADRSVISARSIAAHPRRNGHTGSIPRGSDLKPKDLIGLPWMLAFALRADGWYLRCDIIWAKKNPMPESVTDRPTRAHEYLFLFSKQARYFYDCDAIREAWADERCGAPGGLKERQPSTSRGHPNGQANPPLTWTAPEGRTGRNRRSVWEITTQPTPEAHFATFPEALVEPCIMAGSSEWGCCPECGAPWERVVEKGELLPTSPDYDRRAYGRVRNGEPNDQGGNRARDGHRAKMAYENRTVGWHPTCEHAHEPIPCTVLDCFSGSGTVGKVATRLGRRSILCELSPEYVAISDRRNAQLGLMI
jgi:DNA modification methylase